MRPGSDVRRSDREYSRRQFGQAAAGIVLYFSMRPSLDFRRRQRQLVQSSR